MIEIGAVCSKIMLSPTPSDSQVTPEIEWQLFLDVVLQYSRGSNWL